MGRKKISEPVVQISFSLTPSHLEHLKRLCIDMAYRDKKRYTLSSLVRETMLQAYPPPKNMQTDMFEGK